jgi:hypothetical protein
MTSLRLTASTTVYADGSRKIVSVNSTVQSKAPTLLFDSATTSSIVLTVIPNGNGDALVTNFKLYQDDVLLEEFLEPLTRTVSGLTSNTTHTFYVQKVTTLNTTSSPSIDASTLPVQPSAPVVSAGAVTHDSAVVNWTAEANGDAVVQT